MLCQDLVDDYHSFQVSEVDQQIIKKLISNGHKVDRQMITINIQKVIDGSFDDAAYIHSFQDE